MQYRALGRTSDFGLAGDKKRKGSILRRNEEILSLEDSGDSGPSEAPIACRYPVLENSAVMFLRKNGSMDINSYPTGSHVEVSGDFAVDVGFESNEQRDHVHVTALDSDAERRRVHRRCLETTESVSFE